MKKPFAYYNEFDPKAAAWLRELVKAGLIANGEVDERSIWDVTPLEVSGYTQCHFFAGIGGWSYALRLAGWGDSRPVWTGSAPCQPFSAAGKGEGFADERHLWPVWFHLISICKPPVIFGEQVASKDGLTWLDLVLADLEGAKHAVGVADLSAAGVGAPHIRQRIYFVADASGERFEGQRLHVQLRESRLGDVEAGRRGEACELADSSSSAGLEIGRLESARQEQPTIERGGDAGELALAEGQQHDGSRDAGSGRGQSSNRGELGDTGSAGSGRDGGTGLGAKEIKRALWHLAHEPESAGELGELAHADGGNASAERQQRSRKYRLPPQDSWACEWLPCIDGKARPVEPGTFPLAHGVPNRVGLLRGYGNAIVPQVAAQFIGSYLDADRSEFQ